MTVDVLSRIDETVSDEDFKALVVGISWDVGIGVWYGLVWWGFGLVSLKMGLVGEEEVKALGFPRWFF